MFSAVTLPHGGQWAGGMEGGVGWPRGTTSTVPRRFVLARLHDRTILRCPWKRSRRTVSWSPPGCLDSFAGLSCDARVGLSCGSDDRARLSCGARRIVLILPRDTRRTVLRSSCRTILRWRWTEVEEYDIPVHRILIFKYRLGQSQFRLQFD
jgi:hypothetical protein